MQNGRCAHEGELVKAPEHATVQRYFVLKKAGKDPLGESHLAEFKNFLGIEGITGVRTGVRYDVAGADPETTVRAQWAIFGEAPIDDVLSHDEFYSKFEEGNVIPIESHPGQYDQRGDSAEQCLQLLTEGERPKVKVANFLVLEGNLSEKEKKRIKEYRINPVDSREANHGIPKTLEETLSLPEDIKTLEGFRTFEEPLLRRMLGRKKEGGYELAMTYEDLREVQRHFVKKDRDLTVTELKVIDMYWSDHCRHTTFTTELKKIALNGNVVATDGKLAPRAESAEKSAHENAVQSVLHEYIADRETLYGERLSEKPISLMDLATFSLKWARKTGKLEDLEESREINAASIVVPVEFEDGRKEEWLFMFKNETHNHPTEIEPVGGSSTCLGGVIRDPLSGRSYVFMGMRITGSGDPRESLGKTLVGKLPQSQITKQAAAGFSGYGNQIGVPTLQTKEFYHPGFVAKRFESGCVGGATKKENVIREEPVPGDIVILLGGRTGRDGIGGATGSSKQHTEDSISTCGAEVQKGNPPEERKIQRLFRNPVASRMIRLCNDFGAGGVANAVGELADGLDIDLDLVKLKYQGLDGTEIGISESQERMAVVISPNDCPEFIQLAEKENLEATVMATVKEERTLTLRWRNKVLCDLDRDFLNGGWAKREASVDMVVQGRPQDYFTSLAKEVIPSSSLRQQWEQNLSGLNSASQRGLQQRFDSTVGANTIMNPHGGQYQLTPSEAAVARFPAEGAMTGMAMSAGYDPELSSASPFLGGMYAVVESLGHIIATGGDWRKARLTFQNYFERLKKDPERWGKVFQAQLGAYKAQKELVPSIGGKDSMSGTFENDKTGMRIDVPPTLVSFAIAPIDTRQAIPSCFQGGGNSIIQVDLSIDANTNIPLWEQMRDQWDCLSESIRNGKVSSCHSVGKGGVGAALSEMCFGNKIGARIELTDSGNGILNPRYGSFLLEVEASNSETVAQETGGCKIGETLNKSLLEVISLRTPENSFTAPLDELSAVWEKPLDSIFPRGPHEKHEGENIYQPSHTTRQRKASQVGLMAHPKGVLPVFQGTNCEYETGAAFEREGARVVTPVFGNLTPKRVQESIATLAREIRDAQILIFSGGFSAGDEPDGSGKFIANVLRNRQVSDAIGELMAHDGLILGICNGFQGIIKSCLLPKGEIGVLKENDPTLTWNTLGHYLSRMARHKVVSTLSPWLNDFEVGETLDIPIAHGEGRLIGPREGVDVLWQTGQVPLQYVGLNGQASMTFPDNPNGSVDAIAGLTDSSGRIFGLMAHPERAIKGLSKNVPGERKGQKIFKGGVSYFK